MKKRVLWVIVLFSLGCSKNGVGPRQATRQYDFSFVDHYLEQNAAVYREQVVVLVSQNNEIIDATNLKAREMIRTIVER